MKKKKMQLIGMGVLLLAFLAAFLGLKKYNAGVEEGKKQDTDGTGEIWIIPEDMDEVLELSYDYKGDDVHLQKEDGTWYLEGNREGEIKQTIVNEMLYYLAPLSAVSKLDTALEPEEYGLAAPAQTIRVKTTSAEYVLSVGDYNDITGCHYLKKDGSDAVYTVTDEAANACAYTSEELIKKTEEESAESAAE